MGVGMEMSKNGNGGDRERLAREVIDRIRKDGTQLSIGEQQCMERFMREMNEKVIPRIIDDRHKRAVELERRAASGKILY